MIFDFHDPFLVMDSYFNSLPGYGVDDSGNALRINMDLPGVKKEDLKIEVSGKKLTISADRKGKRQGEFKKTFDLPATVDTEKITASLQDGVLNVEIPKNQQAKPRLIKID